MAIDPDPNFDFDFDFDFDIMLSKNRDIIVSTVIRDFHNNVLLTVCQRKWRRMISQRIGKLAKAL